MKTQLKIAATVALTALGFAATVPAQAYPTSGLEFSQQTYIPPAKAAAQRVVTAVTTTATRTPTFPSAGMEP